MTHNCVGSTYIRTYITYGLFLNCTHVPTLSAVVYDYAECLGQTTSSPPEMWATCHCSRQGSGQEVTHGTHVRYVRTYNRKVQFTEDSSNFHICIALYVQSISCCLSHCWKMKIQTDQSNASYTTMSLSMYGEIGLSVCFSFFHNGTSNLKSTVHTMQM